ncbi:unnamed protein product [Dibothriocephalus latus]|uniref:Uncharacterized protein n=1 Tax=Dibothriocephalus latus TaxID=60516 RepID=A0A3P7P5H9_DIBLA|nr:unnamed protein product [Dibothriocephalus latus]
MATMTMVFAVFVDECGVYFCFRQILGGLCSPQGRISSIMTMISWPLLSPIRDDSDVPDKLALARLPDG